MDFKKKKRDDMYTNYLYTNGINNSLSVPPTTQDELMGLVIDFFFKNQKLIPIDSFSILRNIKRNFRNIEYSTFVFQQLNINDVIRKLIPNGVFEWEEICINLKRAYLIKKVDYERLMKYKMNLSDISINQDFEKYYEKAKNIAIGILKGNLNSPNKIDELIEDGNSNLISRKRHKDIFPGEVEMKIPQFNQINDAMNMRGNSMFKYDEFMESNNFNDSEDIYSLIYAPSAKIMLSCPHFKDAQDIITQDVTDYKKVLEKIRHKYESPLRPFCEYGTRAECEKKKKAECQYVHFKPIISPHTDVTLGDCSYLDTCRHMEICKFVHYQIEDNDLVPSNRKELVLSGDENSLDSQWIECDIRYFDYSILGKFDVIMADPPWDIHMDLPYGTLSDDEMKNLPVKNLQDDGVIFLWVTGRATELARDCLELWGYERKEELVWIKTNQLQRLIRTGRTGHWLNHSKEHCLIGIKGNPKLNRNLDCDVLVSEVRETSRKPDEIYELIERMKPGGRKLELFARPHNRRKGWISLGNQCPGVYLVEEELIENFKKAYPEKNLTKELMEINKLRSTISKSLN